METQAKERLTRHLDLARLLGAKVTTTTGENVVEAILRVARVENVTQLIIGKSDDPAWKRWFRPAFAERLIRDSGPIDVHVVRPERSETPGIPPAAPWPRRGTAREVLRGYGWAFLSVSLVTAFCLAVADLTGYWSIALVTGHYASRLRANQLTERLRERRTATLLSFTQTHLLRQVWGPNAADQSQYLRVHFANLRDKIDPERTGLIKTEPRIGYRLETADS